MVKELLCDLEQHKPDQLSDTENLSHFVMMSLSHMKSIEHYARWTKAVELFKAGDKQIVNQAIKRVEVSIRDIVSRTRPEAQEAIKSYLNDEERMCYFMTLHRQLSELNMEDLEEVCDMVDRYLENKYYGKDREAEL